MEILLLPRLFGGEGGGEAVLTHLEIEACEWASLWANFICKSQILPRNYQEAITRFTNGFCFAKRFTAILSKPSSPIYFQ